MELLRAYELSVNMMKLTDLLTDNRLDVLYSVLWIPVPEAIKQLCRDQVVESHIKN